MHNTMKQSQEINMGREDSKRLFNATCCHICKNNYSKKEIKARDPCHRTGQFRGAPHQTCNINDSSQRLFTTIFNHLHGYDSDLSMKKPLAINQQLVNKLSTAIPKHKQYSFYG